MTGGDQSAGRVEGRAATRNQGEACTLHRRSNQEQSENLDGCEVRRKMESVEDSALKQMLIGVTTLLFSQSQYAEQPAKNNR